MDNQVVEAVTLAGSLGDSDFSIFSLFIRADFVVKFVVLVLLLGSIWCWAIIFQKLIGIKRLNKLSSYFEKTFWSGVAIDELYERISIKPQDPMSAVFVAAMREWKRSRLPNNRGKTLVSVAERIERVMQITATREIDRAERYMTFLATTGSTAPFIGLFGTVWGIMNSFQSIAISRNTSLAIVAPGIAEALFATALGLLAAIPAVVAYNKFNTDSQKYSQKLENFSKRFLTII